MTGDIHPRSFSAMHHVSRVTCHVARHRDDELQSVHHSHVTAPGRVTRLCMTVTSHGTDESGSALIKVKLSISVSSGSGREPPEVDKEQQSAAAAAVERK